MIKCFKLLCLVPFLLVSSSNLAFAADKIVIRPLDGLSDEMVLSMIDALDVATTQEVANDCFVANNILLSWANEGDNLEKRLVYGRMAELWKGVMLFKGHQDDGHSNLVMFLGDRDEIEDNFKNSLIGFTNNEANKSDIYKIVENLDMACSKLTKEQADVLDASIKMDFK